MGQEFKKSEETVDWCETCRTVASPTCSSESNKICKVVVLESGMLVTTCPRCKNEFYVAGEVVKRSLSRGERVWCLPCEHPERWRWGKDEETGRLIEKELENFRSPRKAPRPTKVMVPGEAEAVELENKRKELIQARVRLPEMKELISKYTADVERYEKIITDYPAIIEDLERKVHVAINDPQRGLKVEDRKSTRLNSSH